jgi:hypothetical protein
VRGSPNDTFRQTFAAGRVVMTATIAELPEDVSMRLIGGFKPFAHFNRDDSDGRGRQRIRTAWGLSKVGFVD